MATFCWLPPDNSPIVCSGELALTCSRAIQRTTSSRRRFRLSKPLREYGASRL